MKVILTYFKRSGKYYSHGEYETKFAALHMIWEEVRGMRDTGTLPGLVEGATEFIVSVSVPEHQLDHPHLVI